MRHPTRLLAWHSVQQPSGIGHGQLYAELSDLGLLDATAQLVHDELHAVADPQHGDTEIEQPHAPGAALPAPTRRGASRG